MAEACGRPMYKWEGVQTYCAEPADTDHGQHLADNYAKRMFEPIVLTPEGEKVINELLQDK